MYWLILICAILGTFLYDISNYRKGKDLLYNLLLILVIFASATGYMLGSDSPYYQAVFEDEVPTIWSFNVKAFTSIDSSFNIGFTLFMLFCKSIVPSFYFFKLVYACIINITIFSLFKKNTDKLFMAILFYLMQSALYFNFEILREALAICVFIWSIPYFENKIWRKYLLFCALAISLHVSAVVMLFVPLIQLIKVGSIKSSIIVSLIVIVLIYIGSQFGQSIKPIMQVFDAALDMNRAEYYLNNEKYGSQDTLLISLPVFLFDVVLPIIMLYIIPRKRGVKGYYSFVLLLPILVVLANIVGIFYRFINYFMVFRVLYYVEVFEYLSIYFFKKTGLAGVAFITVCLLYLGIIFKLNELSYNEYGNRSIDRYYPYASIFQDSSNPARRYHRQRAIIY